MENSELKTEIGNLFYKNAKFEHHKGIVLNISYFIDKLFELYDIKKKETQNAQGRS